jgi:hypothetical protein
METAREADSWRPIFLPLGATQAQRAKIEDNLHGERPGPAGGIMGRFGLSGLPENTWRCDTADFMVRERSICTNHALEFSTTMDRTLRAPNLGTEFGGRMETSWH